MLGSAALCSIAGVTGRAIRPDVDGRPAASFAKVGNNIVRLGGNDRPHDVVVPVEGSLQHGPCGPHDGGGEAGGDDERPEEDVFSTSRGRWPEGSGAQACVAKATAERAKKGGTPESFSS